MRASGLNKIVVIPDSFKGTLSAAAFCRAAVEVVAERFPGCTVVSVPVADGGEGTVQAFLSALGGELVTLTVRGPFGEDMTGFYGRLPGGVAVVEMAACAGLPLVGRRGNPALTTTYGVGQLLLHAARRGARTLIVGLGGSATNDAGCGAAAACGVRFFRADGSAFVPTGGTLTQVARIDATRLDPLLRQVDLTVMCDIRNPLYGPDGAACVFAPQKGADAAMVERLDAGLRHIAARIAADLGREIDRLPGGGAAGGMGAGMAAFFGGRLRPGIEILLDTVRIRELLEGADLVITGEGRLDSQSFSGKAVQGVAHAARAAGVPLLALVGGYESDLSAAYEAGVSAVFSVNRLPLELAKSAPMTEENLRLTLDNLLRLLTALPSGCGPPQGDPRTGTPPTENTEKQR
ncbi:MAG: glycerate kinase [Eubacteriales bacterium]